MSRCYTKSIITRKFLWWPTWRRYICFRVLGELGSLRFPSYTPRFKWLCYSYIWEDVYEIHEDNTISTVKATDCPQFFVDIDLYLRYYSISKNCSEILSSDEQE